MVGSVSIMAKVFVFVTTLGNAKLVINVAIYTFVRYLMPKGKFVGRSIPPRIARSRLTDSRAWHMGAQIACRLPGISWSLAVQTNSFPTHHRSILLQNKIQLPAAAVSQLVSWICLRVLGHLFFFALQSMSYDCIEPVDKINGPSHDILDDTVFEAVLRLAPSTLVGVSLAAPYCSKHSRATLFPGGPPPVRTPEEPEGCTSNSLRQDMALQESAAVHDRSRIVSDVVMVHGGISALENPLRSMTWLDPTMSEWVQQQTPFLSACSACQFGADWDKSWLFVCNHPCIHEAAYPDPLANSLAKCFAPHLTKEGLVIKLSDWTQSIPRNPTWHFALAQGRIEDGGSLASTALWATPQHPGFIASWTLI